MGELPLGYEMSEVLLADDLSNNLTYPDTFKLYFDVVKEKMKL